MKIEPIAIPTSFTATWPKSLDPSLQSTHQKVLKIFWNLISIIIFPIGLVRLGITFLKHIVWSYVIPGNMQGDTNVMGKIVLNFFKGKEITLTSPDGAKLSGAFFPGSKHPKKAIIFAFGNAQQWETIDRMLQILKPLGTSFLSINPRSVGKSSGIRYEDGYALDIYSAYEYLIHQQHMDPEDIVLVGYSMGGGYGTCGAALIQQKYPDKKISAMNICSFGNLATEIDAFLASVNSCLAHLARYGIKLLGLDLKAKSAWDTLKGEKCLFYCPSDAMIPQKASLYEAVTKDPRSTTTTVKMHQELLPSFISHNRHFFVDEIKEFYKQLLKMLHLKEEETDIKRIYFNENCRLKDLPLFSILCSGSPYPSVEVVQNQLRLLSISDFPPSLNGDHLDVQVIHPKAVPA